MPTGDEYRALASDMLARSRQEQDLFLRAEYENLAMSYVRLADQADKNAKVDLLYETPPSPKPEMQQPPQQQQQTQPKEQ